MRNLLKLPRLIFFSAMAFMAAPAFAGPYDVAVIIGNRDYGPGIPDVDFAHRDAAAFRRLTVDVLGIDESNIVDLRDATLADFYKTFGAPGGKHNEIFFLIRPNRSAVYVYYSGHGVPGINDKRGYLLPVNGDPDLAAATGYPIDLLYDQLRNLPIPRATVFLDACFSGDSPGGTLFKTASPFGIKVKAPPKTDDRLVILTAASSGELASWHKNHRHGLFTDYLLEGLYGAADADLYGQRDGRVTLGELRGYLDNEMSYFARRNLKRIQTPTVRGPEDHVFASYAGQAYPVRPAIGDKAKTTAETTQVAALVAPPRAELPMPTPTYDIEVMDAEYFVLKRSNLRSGPGTSHGRIGRLKEGTRVTVTGKVRGKPWYRIAYRGTEAFIWAPLIESMAERENRLRLAEQRRQTEAQQRLAEARRRVKGAAKQRRSNVPLNRTTRRDQKIRVDKVATWNPTTCAMADPPPKVINYQRPAHGNIYSMRGTITFSAGKCGKISGPSTDIYYQPREGYVGKDIFSYDLPLFDQTTIVNIKVGE